VQKVILPRDVSERNPGTRNFFRSLSAKFLFVLVPVFLVVAAIGFAFLSQFDHRADAEMLAARVGNHAARVAGAIARQSAQINPPLAQDLIASLAADRAVLCVEIRKTGSDRLVAAMPPVIGCKNVAAGHRLSLPVGDDNTFGLSAVFSEAEVSAAADGRRTLMLLLLAVAFAVSTISAVIAFRWIVARPLARLHTSIRRISETGERVPVDISASDELGDIIDAFNVMLEREAMRENLLDKANDEFRELNRSLEERVQRRTEQLVASEKRLRDLIENFSSGIYVHENLKPIYANQTLIDMMGFADLEEFLSIESIEYLWAPEERDRLAGYGEARLRGDAAPNDYDFWALKKSGEKMLVNNRSFVVEWNGVTAICTTLFNLTERNETEKSLAEQQHLMNSLLATTQEGFWFVDLEGCTTDVNPAICKILNRPREEIIGKQIFEFVDDDNRQIFYEQIERRNQGIIGSYEISLQRPDGSLVPCLNNATPLFSSDGKRIGSVGIWADITDLKEIQRNLEQEKERAQAASIAKSEFLAIASHELRTPMNGVLGMAGLLQASDLSDEQRHRIDTIKQSGEALLGLLNDILDISKIESGRLEIETCQFSIREMMTGVTALLASRAQEKGLLFENHVEADVPDILVGDLTRIRQVLINIVGNAIKFTETGGVVIELSHGRRGRDDVLLRFDVRDTGIGIDAEHQELVFEKFTQADATTTRRFGGTGLGLAICKDLVALLGGEIGVESEIGEGANFWFTVTVGKPASPQPEVMSGRMPEYQPDEVARKRALRILLAEDNQINQEIAIAHLEEQGYLVDIVENGVEAVQAIRDGAYDVILMDVHMPVMDGLVATTEIRRLPNQKSGIPIIALTANAMVGDREKYIAAGMDDYASKPFDPVQLCAMIERCFQNAASRNSTAVRRDTLIKVD
jgi:PAS domain S-box-containing protein